MPAPEQPVYKVGRLHQVPEQIKDSLARLPSAEQRKAAIAALRTMAARLRTDPLDWGDPEYRTVKLGGAVYHAIAAPFVIRYVVYEIEKAVCILDIDLLPK